MFAILAHEPEEFSTNLDSDTETAVDEFGILVYYRTFRLVVVQTGIRLCYAWYLHSCPRGEQGRLSNTLQSGHELLGPRNKQSGRYALLPRGRTHG